MTCWFFMSYARADDQPRAVRSTSQMDSLPPKSAERLRGRNDVKWRVFPSLLRNGESDPKKRDANGTTSG